MLCQALAFALAPPAVDCTGWDRFRLTVVDSARNCNLQGKSGTVVEVFARPHRAYYVKFVADEGATKAEGAFTPDQLSATPPPP